MDAPRVELRAALHNQANGCLGLGERLFGTRYHNQLAGYHMNLELRARYRNCGEFCPPAPRTQMNI